MQLHGDASPSPSPTPTSSSRLTLISQSAADALRRGWMLTTLYLRARRASAGANNNLALITG